jgi:hypothetical protein
MHNTDHEETHEEQVARVISEMIAKGEMTMTIGEDGEPMFSLVEED